jgi:hypothetical protein
LISASFVMAADAFAACTDSFDLPPNKGDAASDSAIDGGTSDASAASDASTDADATSPEGSCASNADCDAGICTFADHECGTGLTTGTCKASVAPGTSCPSGGTSGPGDAAISQYCGCDHALHDSTCALVDAGVDLSISGCTTPANDFPCGYTFCEPANYFCVHSTADASDTYKCELWGATCSTAASHSCPCAETVAGCSTCSGDTTDGVTVVCN